MVDFPYKKEFINPLELWANIINSESTNEQFAEMKNIHVLKTKRGWHSIPHKYKWSYCNKPTAIVVKKNAYDKIDILVDFFSEEARVKANRKNKLSPYDFYNLHYDKVSTKAKELQNNCNEINFNYYLREAIYTLNPECNAFKISVTKTFLQHIGAKKVLDPSAGWGDRLLGAAAANVEVYHGVEPNPRLINPYEDMLKFVNKNSYKFFAEDFLKVKLESKYDTIFTSPPFFDYEVYNMEDINQSINKRNKLDVWIKEFLYPYVEKAWEVLVPGGHYALYISDTKNMQYVEELCNYIKAKLKGNLLGIIAITDEDFSHAFPLWVWRK